MIYNWVRIADINNWAITLYCTQEIYDNVKDEIAGLKHCAIIQDCSTFTFLRRIRRDAKSGAVDKVVFLTLQSHYLPFLFLPLDGFTYGITVHNANVWFKSNVIRKWTDILKRYFRFRMKSSASFFVVNSQNMKEYVEDNFHESRPVYVVPFSLRRSPEARPILSEKLRVVYPGTINKNRKTYDKFIQLAMDFPDDEFVLLGAASSGSDVVSRAAQLPNIKTFEGFLSIEEFNAEIAKAHLLFSEIITDYNGDDMREVYGVTKDSGVSYLMAEFGIPALLNASFHNFKTLNGATVYYEDYDDLFVKYKDLHSAEILHELSMTILDDTFSFSKAAAEVSTIFPGAEK
jgi:hypothetical protein